MKKKLLLSGFFTLSLSFLFAQSSDITGHWTGEIMNQYKVTYDFVAKGDSLTGKDTHYDGSVSDITNGRVMGDSISFSVPIQGQLTPVTGKLHGDTLSLFLTVQGYDLSVDMKKSDEKKE
ncbi:MAG: hypothetical protein ACTHOB_05670 [Ginsengibacter sp.]|jgi:hypothetical protein